VLPGERKSVEPMAAQHQSLRHVVGASPWSEERMLEKVRERAQAALERTDRGVDRL
jgi:SRSO17 transposase